LEPINLEYWYKEEKEYLVTDEYATNVRKYKVGQCSGEVSVKEDIIYLRIQKNDEGTDYGYSVNDEVIEGLTSGRIELTSKDLNITSFRIGDGLYADYVYLAKPEPPMGGEQIS
jgi:hypothetical protein